MALQIEYFRMGVPVGTVPCLKKLWEAKIACTDGLVNHNADLARILDMDNNGSIIGVVKRELLSRPAALILLAMLFLL